MIILRFSTEERLSFRSWRFLLLTEWDAWDVTFSGNNPLPRTGRLLARVAFTIDFEESSR